jgi:very-short-patch-repair endonuclease
MTVIAVRESPIAELFDHSDGVLGSATVLEFLSPGELHWRIESGRWQRPCRGAIVAHSGPLTEAQILRVSLLAAGPRSALGGLTAAWLDHFRGFGDKDPVGEKVIHVLVSPAYKRRTELPWPNMKIHYSRMLTDLDVHPLWEPRRTRMARSLVDAASWMATDRGAMAVLAAGAQQRRVRVQDLRATLDRMTRVRRRRLMYEILVDVEGGAQALSELDFARQVIRRFRLPEPSRQVGRRDSHGRQRWIDVLFDEWKVAVEIDGAQHITPLEQWDDMERDNDLSADGHQMLRFPAWLVRRNPEIVAAKILSALRAKGYKG